MKMMSRNESTTGRWGFLGVSGLIVMTCALLSSSWGAGTRVAAQGPGSGARSNDPSAAQDLVAVIEDLVAANRIAVDQDVLDGFGHISVRHPRDANKYFMVRSMAPALATPDDVLEFDLQTSNALDARGRSPVGERFIHGEIYKARSDVMAVIHCHTLEMVLMGAVGEAPRPLYHMAAFLGEGVPTFDMKDAVGDPDLLVGNVPKGRALARSLGDKPAVLMRGHGAVVVGTSVPHAVGRAVYFKHNSQLQLQALAMNRPVKPLTADEARFASQASWAQTFSRNWEMWKTQSSRGRY